MICYNRIEEKFGMGKEVKRAEGRRIMTREKINRCSVLGIRNWDGALIEQSAGCMPHAKLPAGIAAELRKHVEVAFFLWQCGKHVQKIYFHETCPGGFII